MGNKGGAAIRFKLMDSTLCFVCSHLAAHRENVAGRNADFHKWAFPPRVMIRICDNIRFKKSGEEEESFGILNHDLVFWVVSAGMCDVDRRSELPYHLGYPDVEGVRVCGGRL